MTNEEACLMAKGGDPSALDWLWNRNQPLIQKYAKRLADDLFPLDDCLQESFLALLKAVEAYQPDGRYKFLAYLLKAIEWHLQRVKAKLRRFGTTTLDAPANDDSDETRADRLADENAIDPAEAAADDDLKRVIDDALSKLPEITEKCIRLQWLHGNTLDAVAKHVGINPNTARSRVTQGFRTMRKNPSIRYVADFYSSAYLGTGVGAFRQNLDTSVTERIALQHIATNEHLSEMSQYHRNYWKWRTQGRPDTEEPEPPEFFSKRQKYQSYSHRTAGLMAEGGNLED